MPGPAPPGVDRSLEGSKRPSLRERVVSKVMSLGRRSSGALGGATSDVATSNASDGRDSGGKSSAGHAWLENFSSDPSELACRSAIALSHNQQSPALQGRALRNSMSTQARRPPSAEGEMPQKAGSLRARAVN
jgi:hypothetical protein